MINQVVRHSLNLLPAKPGIYLFKDSDDKVIYVGKASNLRNRVTSYFKSSSDFTEKTRQLVSHISSIDYIVTESETAAIMLECQQIKKYLPYYNILLKDDKSYPYIKIDIKSEWPTVTITRRRLDDGARYIGRIPSASSARHTYELVKKLFPLRSCHKTITGNDSKPCLKYHISRCSAPCTGSISHDDYFEIVKQAVAFLEGREDYVIRSLRKTMADAATNMEFEKAAKLRDQIQSISKVIESNRISFNVSGEKDIIALAHDNDIACVRVFSIKNRKLINDHDFILHNLQDQDNSKLMDSFIEQYYSTAERIPGEILLQYPVTEPRLINTWLSERKGANVNIRVPSRGAGVRLVQTVAANAQQELILAQRNKSSVIDNLAVLSNLKNILNLDKIPNRIEAYDISNIQGKMAVGSMVVFEQAQPRPAHYRRFKIKLAEGPDDYAMMHEVLLRRFRNLSDPNSQWAIQPDLILVDGGKGQLNTAISSLSELKITDIPVIGLAKENEDIFVKGKSEPENIDKFSPESRLFQKIRDEAHRFAVTYHRKLRSNKAKESALDSIPGIGTATKKLLINKFGSVKNIREASLDELTTVKGINHKLANKILESL